MSNGNGNVNSASSNMDLRNNMGVDGVELEEAV